MKRGSHELEFASARRVPIATIRSAVRHFSLAIGVPQKPGLAEQQRMLVRQAPLPHQRVRDRHLQCFGERLQFLRRARRQHAAAGIKDGTPRGGQGIDDARGRRGIET